MHLPHFPLFVPANRTDRYAKASASGADAVILDLEDAVDPADKPAARSGVTGRPSMPVPVIVRINPVDSEWFAADMQAIAKAVPDAIMVPKASSPEHLTAIRQATEGRTAIILLIESAQGLAELPRLLAIDGVLGAAFGHLDFAIDLGCSPDWESLLLARSTLVMQSRLSGKPAPLDGVTANIADANLTALETKQAKKLGFGGKLLIHPTQIEPARIAMQPSDAERAWAQRVVTIAQSGGAIRLDGEMIDAPVLARAQAILNS